MSDDPKITAVHDQWRLAVHGAQLTATQAVDAAAEFLCLVMMSAVRTEKEAHEVLNQSNEHGHIYINENWRSAEALHREREQGAVKALFNRMFR